MRTFSMHEFALTLGLLCALAARADQVDDILKNADRDKAPDFSGIAAWINTGNKPLHIQDLKGKVVLLDFWTSGCINCIHVMEDLKKLEEKYPKELVVIGVHSAKFVNEGKTENLRNAARRFGLKHPVANDNEMKTWNDYDVHSWPTLVLVDPEGKVIGSTSGEGKFASLDNYISKTIAFFDPKKAIDREKVIGAADAFDSGMLQYPGKITAQPELNRLIISDTGHQRILVCTPDGKITATIGSGKTGAQDGSFAEARFDLPLGVAARGDVFYIADSRNHLLRRADLKTGKVDTLAGTGKQGWSDGGPARSTGLNSPWDLALSEDGTVLYVAMAGDHRVWSMNLNKAEIQVLAGTGREFLNDGPFDRADFAQPSGLSLHADVLYEADAEASAVRALDLKKKTVETLSGHFGKAALFTFGDVDGEFGTSKLQHPLAVVWHEGLLYVADTYNHKIKRIDPATKTVSTFAGDGKPGKEDGKAARFYEPGGLAVLKGVLYVADTNNHTIRAVDLKTKETRTLTLGN